MSSDLQSALELQQINNYVSLVGVTAVTYDYFLTLSSEIRYVWSRPWTWVSTIFVLVRYAGLAWAILSALFGTPFIPGPVEFHRCTAVIWAFDLAFPIFLSAADLVMILRVYAMWNRSKSILYLLLFIYVPQVIVSLIFAGVYDTSTYLSVTTVQVLNFSICNYSFNNTPPMLEMYEEIPRFVLSSMLFILAVFQTLKQSVNMYKATKQWQPNQYMERLVRDGIVYFLVNMFVNIANLLAVEATAYNPSLLFLSMLCGITLCPMMPRFIISVRELYDHDVRRGLQGVDTGFGVFSQHIASQNAAVSAIAFADVAPEHAVEGEANEPEAIQFEPLRDDIHGV